MCYARYSIPRCNLWLQTCEIESPYVSVTSQQAKCLQDQTMLDNCVNKYDAKFCYSLVETCSTMLGFSYSGGSISSLPANVLGCIKSEDVMAVCRVKHGETFCFKLCESCSTLTKVTLPTFSSGQLITLPSPISSCVAQENYIAVLSVEYGSVTIQNWMTQCKISVWDGPVTFIQKECIKEQRSKPDAKALCIEKYGAEFCKKLEIACYELRNVPMAGASRCIICKLPEPIVECIASEDFLAMYYAKYGSDNVIVWMKACQITLPTGPLNVMQKECLEKQRRAPDVITVCVNKYNVEFCQKLRVACFEVMKIPVVVGDSAVLPASVAICISSDNWMANCYARYGQKNCLVWRETCRSKYSRIEDDLMDEEKECIESQTIIYKCVQKYDAKFCYKMVEVCCTILDVPYTEGPIQSLPTVVLKCLKTEDVMLVCVARYGRTFCTKLSAVCSKLTSTPIPEVLPEGEYQFPAPITNCLREEQYIAMLIVEYGYEKIQTWMTVCKITVWNGPITVVQKECMQKQTRLPDPRTSCVQKYGTDFCNQLITACFEIKNVEFIGVAPCTVCELPAVVSACLSSEDYVAMCYAKYGAAKCVAWMKACGVINANFITEQQKECIGKQNEAPDVFAVCVRKYGEEFCVKMRTACFEVMHEPIPIEAEGVVVALPPSVSICVASENWMANCYVRYGSTECTLWRHKCVSKYTLTLGSEITLDEKECMENQIVIYKCVQKYDAKFCYKIIEVCSVIYSLPYTEEPVQRLPQRVISCLTSGNVMVLCRAKYGEAFCDKLASACSQLTHISVPEFGLGQLWTIPESIAGCMIQENYIAVMIVKYGFTKIQSWMTVCKITTWTGPITIVQKECIQKQSELPDPRTLCVQKYGADFCNSLIVSCFELRKRHLIGDNLCTFCELPPVIVRCIAEEDYIAMCYAKYGVERCNAWLLACNVFDRYRPLTDAEKACIKRQNELPDVITLCTKKYGAEFCVKLKAACYEVMNLPVPVMVRDVVVETLPQSVSVCISSDNWMARCYVKYGSKQCIIWRQTCLSKFSTLDGQLSSVEIDCMESQIVIYKCVQKYDAKFCYKVIAVCCEMFDVPYTEGPVQRLTDTVIRCLESEDVVVLCRAKHGVDFCNKLGAACSQVTKTSIPEFTFAKDYSLPVVITKCIAEEYYVATLIVEYGYVKVESWLKRCKITVWTGPVTIIQRDCVKKLIVEPDPRTLCVEKYGADFCNKLLDACYIVKQVPTIGGAPCTVCALPAVVAMCISTEDYVAMCFAKYGIARCTAWARICRITVLSNGLNAEEIACMKKQNELPDVMTLCVKKYGSLFCQRLSIACHELMIIPVPTNNEVLAPPVAICIQSENWMAKCYMKYGSKQCIVWRQTCLSKYSRIDGELTEDEKECIKSQTVLYKCVQQYDAKFCYKIIEVCCNMYSLPYTEGPIQRLPQKVVECMQSGDIVVMCRAKHGSEFCDKLGAACSRLTGIAIPEFSIGVEYTLPSAIANCILQENYIAVLIVEHGYLKIQSWMTHCHIIVWNGPITVVQKECIKKLSVQPDPRVTCVQKYGTDFCNKLLVSCYQIRRIQLIGDLPCSVCLLPEVIATCMTSEDYIAMCYAKYGPSQCYAWMIECGVANRPINLLTEQDKLCIKKQSEIPDVILLCKKKYGIEFCQKLQSACFEVMKVPVPAPNANGVIQLPTSISICITSQNWMARCYVKYGSKQCLIWRQTCMGKLSTFDGELTYDQRECMKSQSIIYKCVKKYDAKFCYKIIAVCCEMYSVPYVDGPIQQLPVRVVNCLYSEDVVVICRAKHGAQFCNKLGAVCSQLTRTPIPEVTYGREYKLPEVITTCISQEYYIAVLIVEYGFSKIGNWMRTCHITVWNGPITAVQKECMTKQTQLPDPRTVCVQKYGMEFCTKMISACFEIKRIRLIGDSFCSVCELPAVVSTCLSTEEYVPLCYAKYGAARCNAWMLACGVMNRFGLITEAQKACIQKQNELPDVIVLCKQQYGIEFCQKLKIACFELMNIPVPVEAAGVVQVLPASISICIQSGNWLARCYVRYSSALCIEWRRTCRDQYSRLDIEVTTSERECMESQAVIYKCVQKYDAKFCYKVIAVCSQMYSVPYVEGPVQKLPRNVITCLRSDDVVVLCRAKHGFTFCSKLAHACSRLTQTAIPTSTPGRDYRLPDVIVNCISQENYIAVLIVEYGFVKIETWMTTCKITVWNGPITVVQKECMQKQTRLPDAKTLCVQKYGADFCNKLITSCYQVRQLPVVVGDSLCTVCELPAVISTCISEENFVAMCLAKYGFAKCSTWMVTCGVRDRFGPLTAEQIACIRRQNELPDAITACSKKYGLEFCNRLRLACYDVMKIPVPAQFGGALQEVPKSISICVTSENWIATCYVKYGSQQCDTWRETCKDQYWKIETDVSETEKECMQSQMVIFKCVQKHDAKFCYKIIAVCCSMFSIPYVEGPVQKLPDNVIKCLYSEDPVVLCRARRGVAFCNKLGPACATVTGVVIPQVTPGREYTLPAVITKCMIEENYIAVLIVEYGIQAVRSWTTTCKVTVWNGVITLVQKECIKRLSVTPDAKTVCIKKYGIEFCTKLISACYERRRLNSESLCTACQMSPVIATCVSQEDVVAMCFAKYGNGRCITWMTSCNVRDVYGVITVQQIQCIKRQYEMPDVVAICANKYGIAFCNKLRSACFEVMNIPLVQNTVVGTTTVQVLPQQISICMQSDNWMAHCYALHNSKLCIRWRQTCRSQYSRNDLELNDDEKDCMRSQSVQYKCEQQYGTIFCQKLTAECSSMLSIPFSQGSIQKLPQAVVQCVYKPDPVVVCRAKHCSTFCNRLGPACATVTQTQIPLSTPGQEYRLPDQIINCMLQENILAMCYAKYCPDVCNAWMKSCSIINALAELNGSQLQCFKSMEQAAQQQGQQPPGCFRPMCGRPVQIIRVQPMVVRG